MTSVAQAIAALARRRKRLLIAAAAVLALVYLPIFPYSPRCYDPYEPTTVGSIHLAPQYHGALISALRYYNVPYISVGPFVLLRFWTWLADPDSDIANMSNRAIRHFIDERFGASIGDLPQSLQGLIEETRQSYGDLELVCPLVRVVAIEGF